MEPTRLGLTAVAASLFAVQVPAQEAAGNAALFPSAEEVRPLLVGLSIPEGTLRNQAGEPIAMGPGKADRPMVYVFYRGHW